MSVLLLLSAATGLLIFWGFANIKDAILFGCVIFPIFIWACANAAYHCSASIASISQNPRAFYIVNNLAPFAFWSLAACGWTLFSYSSPLLELLNLDDPTMALQIARDSWGDYFSSCSFDRWKPPTPIDFDQIVRKSKEVSPGVCLALLAFSWHPRQLRLFFYYWLFNRYLRLRPRGNGLVLHQTTRIHRS